MDPTHPDFFRRADPRAKRAWNIWRLGLLLPMAAALPLLVTVIRHLPERERRAEAPAAVVEGPLVEVESEAVEPVSPRRVERRKSHVVVPGDTLSEIAQRNGCDVASLAAANGLKQNGKLLVGTILLLPRPGEVVVPAEVEVVAAPPAKPRSPVLTPVPAAWTKPAAAAERVAVRKPGAQVRSPNYPYVAWPEEPEPPGPTVELGGQEEAGPVPGPVQPVSGLTLSLAAKTTIQYLVQPGDEWERIAAAHFTTADVLKRINRIEIVTAGQVIEIPVDQCLTTGR